MTWISRCLGALGALSLAFVAPGCDTLTVSNPNDPDRDRALASGGDVRSLVGGAFGNWYYSMQGEGPSTTTGTMADHYTASWGNWGMRTYSGEPRAEFNNSSTEREDILQVVEGPWYKNYAAVVSANLAIRAINNGLNIDPADPTQTPMVKAASTFIQGAALANIALFFDSGYVVDENTDVTTVALGTRAQVRDAALAKLDAAIGLAGASTFKLPTAYLNFDGWTNVQLGQVANTIGARAIAYFARTPAENGTADWAKVLQYASNGISSGVGFDPSIAGDGGVNWYDPYKAYMDEYTTWSRVDMRVVCLMDPTQPCRHPNDQNVIPPPGGNDFRMTGGGDPTLADFIYSVAIPHNPARGLYHFSHVGHQRYFYASVEAPQFLVGNFPFMLRAENDLLWAEGLVRTNGDKALAAQKINNSRVVRGQLAALTGAEADQVLLDAIFYERDVELMGSAGVVPYYDMRRTSRPNGLPQPNLGLQPLTNRHFPVPARELQLLGKQIYTFGGPSKPDFSVAGSGPQFSVVSSSSERPNFGQIGGRTIVGPGAILEIANEMNRAQLRAVRAHRPY